MAEINQKEFNRFLKLSLKEMTEEEFSAFQSAAAEHVISETAGDGLVKGFIDNCGISAGERTVYYELAWSYYRQDIDTRKDFVESDRDFFRWFRNKIIGLENNPDEILEYDVLPLKHESYIKTSIELLRRGWGINEPLFRTEFCRALHCFLLEHYQHLTELAVRKQWNSAAEIEKAIAEAQQNADDWEKEYLNLRKDFLCMTDLQQRKETFDRLLDLQHSRDLMLIQITEMEDILALKRLEELP